MIAEPFFKSCFAESNVCLSISISAVVIHCTLINQVFSKAPIVQGAILRSSTVALPLIFIIWCRTVCVVLGLYDLLYVACTTVADLNCVGVEYSM